jgi:hypothetical protein
VAWSGQAHIDAVAYTAPAAGPAATPTAPPPAPGAPTATAPAAPTPTPAATATTPAGPQTVTFDDLPGQDRPLDGAYPAGVIDWGTGAWWLAGPTDPLASKSVTLDERSLRGASFRFVVPRRLVSLRAAARTGGAGTVSLSCAGQPTTTAAVPLGEAVTVATGWTGTCTTVTVDLSDGWRTHLDDLVYDAEP